KSNTFFKPFFDDELLDIIVYQTKLYAHQKNLDLDLTRDEFCVILGALLLSGYAKYPNKRMFWNNTSDVPIKLKNSMLLNRFETILHHICFNDNMQIDRSDKLYKLRPVIDILNDRFRKHGGLHENISIDESMILYYGKHHARPYIRGKPIGFGFENWALCTNSGYLMSFEIYTGKSQYKSGERGFGLGGDIGTYQFVAKDNTLLVQWNDNKIVTVASNFENEEIVHTTRWFTISKSRKCVLQTKLIANYNKRMGGVDKMDGLIALYRSRIRQRKWY
ncbi:hypothetical protein HUJ04_001451, partial [Dendroctonus ponderosae]